jgi:hypothetical protein
MRNHVLPSVHPKMGLGRVRGSDFSSSRMTLKTLYLPLNFAKCDFVKVNKAIFQVVEKP